MFIGENRIIDELVIEQRIPLNLQACQNRSVWLWQTAHLP